MQTPATLRPASAGPARPLSISEWVDRTVDGSGPAKADVWLVMTAALGLLEKHAARAPMQSLYEAVEGAEALARSEEARPRAGGGLFGGVLKSAGGLSGQAVADAMGVMARLKEQGVSKDDLKRLLPAARQALRAATGRDLFGEAIKTVPGVGGILGAD